MNRPNLSSRINELIIKSFYEVKFILNWMENT